MMLMAQTTKKTRKSNAKATALNGGAAAVGDAREIFLALLEAERWLFTAGEGLAGGDPETAAAIQNIRRQVCERLEKLQANAYRAFDGALDD